MSLPASVHIEKVDYFQIEKLSPRHSFAEWGTAFNDFVRTQGFQKNFVVGYSLGGRLALQAVGRDPELWAQGVCVSTNPGFADDFQEFNPVSSAREKRWISDSSWAEKFQSAPWENVLKAWNGQPVFAGSVVEPARLEKNYSRELLSLALTNWSLAQQPNMRTLLRLHPEKFSLIVGASDQKFYDIGVELRKSISSLQVYAVPDASHRILFDRPQDLGHILKQLIK